jgi:hypothetical protein
MAGTADALSLGTTKWLRDRLGGMGVDECSGTYGGAQSIMKWHIQNMVAGTVGDAAYGPLAVRGGVRPLDASIASGGFASLVVAWAATGFRGGGAPDVGSNFASGAAGGFAGARSGPAVGTAVSAAVSIATGTGPSISTTKSGC